MCIIGPIVPRVSMIGFILYVDIVRPVHGQVYESCIPLVGCLILRTSMKCCWQCVVTSWEMCFMSLCSKNNTNLIMQLDCRSDGKIVQYVVIPVSFRPFRPIRPFLAESHHVTGISLVQTTIQKYFLRRK